MLLEESLPITFAEIAPPIDICSPPGTEYRVNLCFFSLFTTSLILAPTSISINFFFLSIKVILLNFFKDITKVSLFA